MLRTIILYSALSIGWVLASMANAEIAGEIVVQNELTDEGRTAQVYELYNHSAALKTSDILVNTVEDCVILSGSVDTKKQYERAIILAQSVLGINAINADNLYVKSSDAPLNDLFITAKIKAKLIKENIFGSSDYWPVKIETKNSIVYLSGHVNTREEGEKLIKLAKEVEGTESVISAVYYQMHSI